MDRPGDTSTYINPEELVDKPQGRPSVSDVYPDDVSLNDAGELETDPLDEILTDSEEEEDEDQPLERDEEDIADEYDEPDEFDIRDDRNYTKTGELLSREKRAMISARSNQSTSRPIDRASQMSTRPTAQQARVQTTRTQPNQPRTAYSFRPDDLATGGAVPNVPSAPQQPQATGQVDQDLFPDIEVNADRGEAELAKGVTFYIDAIRYVDKGGYTIYNEIEQVFQDFALGTKPNSTTEIKAYRSHDDPSYGSMTTLPVGAKNALQPFIDQLKDAILITMENHPEYADMKLGNSWAIVSTASEINRQYPDGVLVFILDQAHGTSCKVSVKERDSDGVLIEAKYLDNVQGGDMLFFPSVDRDHWWSARFSKTDTYKNVIHIPFYHPSYTSYGYGSKKKKSGGARRSVARQPMTYEPSQPAGGFTRFVPGASQFRAASRQGPSGRGFTGARPTFSRGLQR